MPEAGVEVIGAGIGGNKVPDLERRLDNDVLAKKPTTVVVYIGINDVWHSQRGQGTPKDAFDKGLRSLVERIRASGSRVILCTPSVIGEKAAGTNPLDAMLDDYAGVTRAVAADMKTGLLDLRKAFVAHLAAEKKNETDRGLLTTDGVHLNAAGNRFVADRMLEALGVPAGAATGGRLLRHVVLFKFKETSTPGPSLKNVTRWPCFTSVRTSRSASSAPGVVRCCFASAAAKPAASPICIHTGSRRTAPHATCVALRQTGTSRLSISCGSRQR